MKPTIKELTSMIEEIDLLVDTEFNALMETKLLPDSRKYTQRESRKMADIISKVYLISHMLHCLVCLTKFRERKKNENK